jgi:glycosyltransferase involved in cell wall biosynthesis
MPDPRASVIIPTYRRPKATVRAVRSALTQTIEDLEVIVIDDCSGDGTPEAIEAIGDPRLRVIRHERNLGVCAARNRGIAEARAPYIALLDSDDVLLEPSIDRRIERLEHAPESAFVYSRAHFKLSNRICITAPRKALASEDRFLDALVIEQGLATSAMLARTEALRQCPFDVELFGFDDWHVALKLARMGPVAFVEEPLSVIHGEDESEGGRITFSFNPETEHRLIELHREEFDASPRAEAAVLYQLAMRAVRIGRRDLAVRYLERASTLDPDHKKVRTILRCLRAGLWFALPFFLRVRWRFKLATGWVE